MKTLKELNKKAKVGRKKGQIVDTPEWTESIGNGQRQE
jgi:hypothetical protein